MLFTPVSNGSPPVCAASGNGHPSVLVMQRAVALDIGPLRCRAGNDIIIGGYDGIDRRYVLRCGTRPGVGAGRLGQGAGGKQEAGGCKNEAEHGAWVFQVYTLW